MSANKEDHRVTREQRAKALTGWHAQATVPFRGCTVWFTGLAGSGKTTLAMALEEFLVSRGIAAYSLDADNVRSGLNNNLGFSPADQEENVRRVAEVSKLFADSGQVCITAFISPFAKDRSKAKKVHDDCNTRFFEVYLSAPLDVCEKRDPKGQYAKARAGKIPGFTGVESAYEPPKDADLTLASDKLSVAECLQEIVSLLVNADVLPPTMLNVVHELFVPQDLVQGFLAEAQTLPTLAIQKVDVQWIQVVAEGWAAPLTGFMTEKQYLQCLHFSTLFDEKSGVSHSMSIPITLAVSTEDKTRLADAPSIALTYTDHTLETRTVAILRNPEFFEHRKEERCCRVWGTFNQAHPGIAMVMESGDWLVGGHLDVTGPIKWNDGYDHLRLSPNQLRKTFEDIGADAVFVFQLRNPLHNGHVLLLDETRQQLLKRGFKKPLLLLHCIGGWTKEDDVPLHVRVLQHEAVIDAGLEGVKKDQLVMSIFPTPMLYAGPREVQWHVKARLAVGVGFYIVGRDPAGMAHPSEKGKDLYDPSHGLKVLQMAQGLDLIEIIPFRVAAYDRANRKMSLYENYSHGNFEFISGTKIRQLARSGTELPPGFMVPEAWRILAEKF